MASFERGTKRQCLHCGTKFYDLNRVPILCPHCGKVFQLADKPLPRYAKEVAKTEDTEETEATAKVVDKAGPEIVSLDEAKDEEENSDEDIPEVEGEDDVEDIGKDDADVFLEDEEDDDDKTNLGFDVGNRDDR